jgi:hypothetical protein
MKFDTLYDNLIFEQDEPQQAPAEQPVAQDVEQAEPQNPGAMKVPQPGNFDDVEPMPQIDTESIQNQLKQQIAKLVQLSQEVNGYEGPNQSVQQFIFSLDKPGGVYSGISSVVANDITNAAGALLDAANKLSRFVISTSKRAQDLASSR